MALAVLPLFHQQQARTTGGVRSGLASSLHSVAASPAQTRFLQARASSHPCCPRDLHREPLRSGVVVLAHVAMR